MFTQPVQIWVSKARRHGQFGWPYFAVASTEESAAEILRFGVEEAGARPENLSYILEQAARQGAGWLETADDRWPWLVIRLVEIVDGKAEPVPAGTVRLERAKLV